MFSFFKVKLQKEVPMMELVINKNSREYNSNTYFMGFVWRSLEDIREQPTRNAHSYTSNGRKKTVSLKVESVTFWINTYYLPNASDMQQSYLSGWKFLNT